MTAGEITVIAAYAAAPGKSDRVVARTPDGRYGLYEAGADGAHLVGPSTSLNEAFEIARLALDGDALTHTAPPTLHKLALVVVALGVQAGGFAPPPAPEATP